MHRQTQRVRSVTANVTAACGARPSARRRSFPTARTSIQPPPNSPTSLASSGMAPPSFQPQRRLKPKLISAPLISRIAGRLAGIDADHMELVELFALIDDTATPSPVSSTMTFTRSPLRPRLRAISNTRFASAIESSFRYTNGRPATAAHGKTTLSSAPKRAGSTPSWRKRQGESESSSGVHRSVPATTCSMEQTAFEPCQGQSPRTRT